MGKPAALVGDMITNSIPHCHAPIHPAAPVPTPVPAPSPPMAIVGPGAATVLITNKPAALVTDKSAPCIPGGCTPGGPGMIAMGSMTVMITNKPAARVGDLTSHPSCVAPIPGPTGTVTGPGAATVMIGG